MKEYYQVELFHWAGMGDAHLHMLKDILEQNPDWINEKNRVGDNCLLIAVRSGSIEAVKFLVKETEIDINYEPPLSGRTLETEGNALIAALAKGHYDIAEYLIENTSININSTNERGETIYHIAAKAGNADFIEKMLERDEEKQISKKDKMGRTCLFNLVEGYPKHKDYWCFELIQQSLSVDELFARDFEGNNVLDFLAHRKKYFKTIYEPLISVINSRTLNYQLNIALDEKNNVANKKTKI